MDKILEIVSTQQEYEGPNGEYEGPSLWIALDDGRLVGQNADANEIIDSVRKRARWMGKLGEDSTDAELADLLLDGGWSNGYTSIRPITEAS